MVKNHGLLMWLLMINGAKMGLSMVIWLVVWNMFVHILGMSSSQLMNSYFSEG
jgi:hypothetical protein